jgi:hypothetical protein
LKSKKNPKGKIRLTPQQLNTRAIVTARQAVTCTISMSEALEKGPFAVRTINNGNGLALDVGWMLSRPAIEGDAPEFIMRVTPKLNKDRGGITLKPFYSNTCPGWVREKVAERFVLIQQQNAQVEKNVMEDIRKGSWC